MGSAGTLAHRRLECPALKAHKQPHLDPDTMHAASMGWGGATFWGRALLPGSALPAIPRITEERRRWHRDASQLYFTGHICVDGSGLDFHWFPALNRVGWSAAQVEDGKFIAVLYGNGPGGEQTVSRADLCAIRAVFPLLLRPATIWPDHADHVTALHRGRE